MQSVLTSSSASNRSADTVQAVAQSLYSEFKEPLYAPPSLLLRMVEAGLLGRKTGHGFFDYPANHHHRP